MSGREVPAVRLGLGALFLAVIDGSIGFIVSTTGDDGHTPSRKPAAAVG